MQPHPSPLNFFEEEPLSWPSAVRVKRPEGTKPDSHRGGQGFESPQLHPETAGHCLRRVLGAGVPPARLPPGMRFLLDENVSYIRASKALLLRRPDWRAGATLPVGSYYAKQRLRGAPGCMARSVVVAGCEDDDLCCRDDVDEAVLVVYAP